MSVFIFFLEIMEVENEKQSVEIELTEAEKSGNSPSIPIDNEEVKEKLHFIEVDTGGISYLDPVETLQRRSSIPEFQTGFDCGMAGKPPHLSRILAKQNAALLRPLRWDKSRGTYVGYDLETDFGRLQGPLEKYLGVEKPSATMLDQYGVGVSFFFKLLKSLSILFAILSIITLPSLIMFSACSAIPPAQLMYMVNVNSQNTLATATIASLSVPIPSCREASDGDTFGFSCPGTYKIGSIVSYYGQDHGSCACPGPNQPDDAGFCKAPVVSSIYPGQCGNNPLTQQLGSCFLSTTRYTNNCCAFNVLPDGTPNLTALNIVPNEACNSYTAPYIATAYCQGKQSCEFVVDPSYVYEFPVDNLPSYANASDVCEHVYYNGLTQICATTMTHYGSFSGCSVDQYGNMTRNLIFEAICLSNEVKIFDSIYYPETIVTVTASLDAVAILVFILGVMWIRHVEDIETEEADRATCTASDYTVVCYTLPRSEDGSILDPIAMKLFIKQHFESIISKHCSSNCKEKIEIADINFSTAYSSYISSACERGNACRDVDLCVLKIQSQLDREVLDKKTWESRSVLDSLKDALLRFDIANDKCLELSSKAEKEMFSCYITFANESSFVECQNIYPNIGYFTRFIQDPDLRMNGQTVYIERAPNPTDINWENVAANSIERFIRVIITTICTLLILGFSYAMIYEAMYQASKFDSKQVFQACSTFQVLVSKDPLLMSNTTVNVITYQDVLYDQNPSFYNLTNSYGSLGYLLCYCQEILYQTKSMSSMKSYMFFDGPTQSEQPYCDNMISGSLMSSGANYVASFIILLVNTNLTSMLRMFAGFERHLSKTGEVMSLAIKLFFAQYINTALLSLIIYGSLKRVGAHNLNFGQSGQIQFGVFTGNLTDYDSGWYFSVGASMTFTMFMFILGNLPNFSYGVIKSYVVKIWDRRWSFQTSISHCDLQRELDNIYSGPESGMEEKYATLLALVFVDVTFSATMPLLYIITLINLGIIYGIEKYLFLRVSRAPPVLSSNLPKIITLMFFWAALIHSANGLWMFGNTSFYSPDTRDSVEFTDMTINGMLLSFVQLSHDWNYDISWTQRIFGKRTLFLFIIVLVMASILALRLFNDVIMDYFGFQHVLNYFMKYINRRFSLLERFYVELPVYERQIEGNPPYFEAIPLSVLKLRLHSGLLSKDVAEKYLARIYEVEGNGISSALEKASEDIVDVNSGTNAELNPSVNDTLGSQCDDICNVDKVSGVMGPPKSDENHVVVENETGSSCNPSGHDNDIETKDELSMPKEINRESSCSIDIEMDVDHGRVSMNQSDTDCVRMLVGHESYNMATSPVYLDKFGLNTIHIHRVNPNDWVIAQAHLEQIDPDSPELAQIIRECGVNRDDDGNIPWSLVLKSKFDVTVSWFFSQFSLEKLGM